MARMTRVQRRDIERALYHVKRAAAYINRPDTAVAKVDNMATTTLHYTRADGRVLYEVAKDIGSDLCGLSDCIRILEQLERDNG